MLSVNARQILGLALPMAGEQFLIFGVLLFDTAVTGRLGVEELSAQAVVMRWAQFTSVLFSIMAIGGSILVARAVGKADDNVASDVLQSALALALLTGLAAMSFVIAAGPQLVDLIGVEPPVHALATPYLQLMALSFPLNFILLSAGGCIRGAGDAHTPLLVMLAANAVHVVLAILFTSVIRLSLSGLALATILSRLGGVVLVMLVLWRGTAKLRMRLMRPRLRTMREIWSLGSAVGGEQLALRLGQLVNLRLITGLGTGALAAYLVTLNSLSIVLMIGMGFMAAALTLAGQQVGAGAGQQVFATSWHTVHLGWVVVGGLGALFVIWPGITRLFSGDAAVLADAELGLRIVIFGVPFEIINQVLTGSIRGAGDARFPMLFTTLGHWLVRLPLMSCFLFVFEFGLNSVFVAMIIEMAVRAGLNIWRLNSGFWLRVQAPDGLEAR